MRVLTELTETPVQRFKVPVSGLRSDVDFKLYFAPTQMSWYFDFTCEGVEYKGNKLVLGSNILRGFKNIIPFGLNVQADKGIEPFALDDFATGRVTLSILDADEVKEVEGNVFNIW